MFPLWEAEPGVESGPPQGEGCGGQYRYCVDERVRAQEDLTTAGDGVLTHGRGNTPCMYTPSPLVRS